MARIGSAGAPPAAASEAADRAQAVRSVQPRARVAGHESAATVTPAEQLAVEIELAIREIEHELRRRLDLGERIAIGFVLERFADRVPDMEDNRRW